MSSVQLSTVEKNVAYINFIKAFRPISCPHHPLFFLLCTYIGCLLKLHTSFPLSMLRIALNLFFLIIPSQIAYIHLLFLPNVHFFFCNARKIVDLKASEKKKEFWDVKLIKTCDKLTHSNKRDL